MKVKVKTHTNLAFGAYQPPSMGTQKWHLPDHSVDLIKHVGCLQFLHGGLHEGSHKIFETVFAKSLKRRVAAMDEAVGRHNEKL